LTPAFADDPGTITVSENDTQVEVWPGATLKLELHVNGGTPYVWHITSTDDAQLTNESGEDPEVTSGGGLGAPETITYSFHVGEEGTTTLSAEMQPIGGGDPVKSAVITVHVKIFNAE
jgi:predicted secreted protein